MKLSVIMPTYNEAGTLAQIIEKVRDVPIDKEIIVVNDGSTDQSDQILQQYVDDIDVKVVHHKENRGKGMAIRTGSEYVSGDIVIIQDADLETNPNDYLHLVEPIQKGESKVVYGSRLLGNKVDYSWKYYFGGRFVTWIANLLYGQNITDEPACYKVFDAGLFQSIPLECERFEFCPEVTAKVSRLGHKIVELPMEYYPRDRSEGKKLQVFDGIEAVWTLFRYKFWKP
jgi:glycosyltransferase involved in cell wall biosynthesis